MRKGFDILGPTGVPIGLKRLYPVTCPLCGKETIFDLGAPGDVLRCPKCETVLGGKTIIFEEGQKRSPRKHVNK